jgi:hypothetical protein
VRAPLRACCTRARVLRCRAAARASATDAAAPSPRRTPFPRNYSEMTEQVQASLQARRGLAQQVALARHPYRERYSQLPLRCLLPASTNRPRWTTACR